jgi:hypothetical protein
MDGTLDRTTTIFLGRSVTVDAPVQEVPDTHGDTSEIPASAMEDDEPEAPGEREAAGCDATTFYNNDTWLAIWRYFMTVSGEKRKQLAWIFRVSVCTRTCTCILATWPLLVLF